jgi:plasmid stability protein
MADLKVRNLDESVASALKARAQAKGVSLEEEVRLTLTASVAADREELVRRAKALPAAAGGAPGKTELDSARPSARSGMPGAERLLGHAFES